MKTLSLGQTPRQAGEARSARLTLTLTPTMTPAPHLTPQLTSTCRRTLLLPASLVNPTRVSTSRPTPRVEKKEPEALTVSTLRPRRAGEGSGISLRDSPASTATSVRRAEHSASGTARSGHLRARRTRAERGSGVCVGGERFLGRLRSSGRPPRGPPQRAALPRAAPSAQLLPAAGASACGRPRSLRRVPGLDARARGEWDSLSHWFVSLYHSETGRVELN